MAKAQSSGKRLQINKANATMVVVVAVAAFLVTTSLVASRALLEKRSYQARVINEKEKAANQLQANIQATNSLVTSYKAFVETPDNIIGGNPSGTGERDGNNAKIVLDALPSKYDYPALAASLEKIITSRNYKINSIAGTDDEIAQANAANNKPQPIEMPFELDVSGSFDSMKDLTGIFEKSIRPIKVKSLDLQSTNGNIDITVSAISYYQPEKTLNIDTKVVK